jgi:hypothetical protein
MAMVERALALDADCHLAIFVRGLVAGTRGRPEAGLIDLRRAHELRPGDVNVLLELCRWSLAAGLDCKAVVDRLVALDPLTAQSHLIEAMYYGLYGPVERAASPARRSIGLAQEASLLHFSAAFWLAVAGARDEAVEVLDRLRAASSDLRSTLASFLGCALAGDAAGAGLEATPETERAISNEFIAFMMASGHALLGQQEDALRCLHAALALGFINHPALIRNAALADCLGEDPRFHSLLAEIEPRWKTVVAWDRGLDDATRTQVTRS